MSETPSTAGAPVTATPGAPAAPTASPVPSSYRSGHCGHGGHHTSCRGTYGKTACGCTCHIDPAPEPHDVLKALAAALADGPPVRLGAWELWVVQAEGEALTVQLRHLGDGRTVWYGGEL